MFRITYDDATTLIKGAYPTDIKYGNIVVDDVNKNITNDENYTFPYIEISKEEYLDNLSKTMCVVEGVYQEYFVSDEISLVESKQRKYIEINNERDKKVVEDSARYAEAETIKISIDSLTTIEEIEAFDIGSAFS